MENKIFKSRQQFLKNYLKKKLMFIYDEQDNCNSSKIFLGDILNQQMNNKEFIKNLKNFSYYYMCKYVYEKRRNLFILEFIIPFEYIEDKKPIPNFVESSLLHEKIRLAKTKDVDKLFPYRWYAFNVSNCIIPLPDL